MTPAAIPVPATLTAGFYDDTLTVTTTAPGATPVAIPLDESASGAILQLTMASTAFGTVINTTASLPFSVTNTGNVDATITATATGAGFSANVSSTPIDNGASAPGTATFKATTNASVTGTLSISTTTALCAALPQPLTLTATGAVPVATYSGATLAVSGTCGGGAATTATLSIQNTGNAPLTVSGVGSLHGDFTVQSVPGTIASGQAGSIVLQGATPAGSLGGQPYGDTLSFTTNEPGTPTHTVPVTDTVHGANLSFSVASISLTTCGDYPYSVLNGGDRAASVTANSPYPGSFGSWYADGAFWNGNMIVPVSIPAAGSVGDDIYSDLNSGCPASLPALTFTSTGSASNPVCVPLPAAGITIAAPSSGSACFCDD